MDLQHILREQRENCYAALGKLPKNLQKAYRKRIMDAKRPVIVPVVEPEPKFSLHYPTLWIGIGIGLIPFVILLVKVLIT
jgi:hypothetical protein